MSTVPYSSIAGLCMRVLRCVLLSVLCCALLPRLALAGAQDPDDGCLRDQECRARYEKAMKAYAAGRYEAALPEFQAAYSQRQMAWLLVNIGRTLHRLGRLEEAVQHYNNYEKTSLGSDPDTLRKVKEYRAQAQAALDAMRAGGGNLTPPPATTGATTPIDTTSTGEKPLYKKWWFWAAIGGGVVAITAIGVGIGVGVSNANKDPIPPNAPVFTPSF